MRALFQTYVFFVFACVVLSVSGNNFAINFSAVAALLSGSCGLRGDLAQAAMLPRRGPPVVIVGPIILVYPFVQKYFVKGALVGSQEN